MKEDFRKEQNPPAAYTTEGFTLQTGMVKTKLTVVRNAFQERKVGFKTRQTYANKPKEVKLIDRECNRWLSKDLGKIYWTVGYWNAGFFNDIG